MAIQGYGEVSERVQVDAVAHKTGLAKRTIQKMAQRGEIPGAAKLGSTWTFDRIKLARWIRNKERECQITSINAVAYGMRGFKWQVATSENPYRQEIAQRRKGA